MNLSSLTELKDMNLEYSIAQLCEMMSNLSCQLDLSTDHRYENWTSHLPPLNHEKKLYILDELQFHTTYLQHFIRSGGTFQDLTSKKNESFFVRRSLARRGLEFVDSTVESRFRDDDIIEIYDSSGVQICRSWSYFKNCSYSLIDLLTFSWGELYSRPRLIEKNLLAKMTQLFSKESKTFDYNLPEYVISEKFSRKKYSFLFSMKYASPLQDKISKQVVAFVTTGELKKLFVDHLHDNTYFI